MYQFNQYYLYRDIVFKNNKSTFKMFVHKVLLLFLFSEEGTNVNKMHNCATRWKYKAKQARYNFIHIKQKKSNFYNYTTFQ